MIYTGPEWEFTPEEAKKELFYKVNASMHSVLPDGNFVGIKLNDEFSAVCYPTVLRPQMKLILASNLAV